MAADGISKHNQLHFKMLTVSQNGTKQECEWCRSNLLPPVEISLKAPFQLMLGHSDIDIHISISILLLNNSTSGSYLLTKNLKLIPMVESKQLFTYYGLSSRKIFVLIWFSKSSGLLCHVFLVLWRSLEFMTFICLFFFFFPKRIPLADICSASPWASHSHCPHGALTEKTDM